MKIKNIRMQRYLPYRKGRRKDNVYARKRFVCSDLPIKEYENIVKFLTISLVL